MKAGYAVSVAVATLVSGLALPAMAQDQDALLKRGEYLMNGPVACGNCHNTRAEDMSFVPGMEFAGGFHIVDKGIDAYAANITPDPDTGIGTWTDEEIITAIREGKTPEGEIIFPPMPVPTYNNMSDDDVKAIVAYLRTVKPVHNEVPESKFEIPQQAMPPAKGAPAPSTERQGRLWRLHRHRARPLLRVPHAARRQRRAGHVQNGLGAGGFMIELAPGRRGGDRRTSPPIPRPASASGATTTSRRRSPRASAPMACTCRRRCRSRSSPT